MQELKIHDVVRVGNSLKRIHKLIDEDVVFVDGNAANINDISAVAFPAGTTFTYDGITYSSSEDIAVVHDDTVIKTVDGSEIPIMSQWGAAIGSISFPESNAKESIERMLFEDEFCAYLDYANISYSISPVRKILTESYKSKERLKEILSNHPQWNEETLSIDMLIDVPVFQNKDKASMIYVKICNDYLVNFGHDFQRIRWLFDEISFTELMSVDKDVSEKCKALGLHIANGMKPSRAVRKFFAEIGADRTANFEKDFAELADYLSNKTIKRRMTLSIHPLDFLRMSEGKSWKSCHNIREGGCFSNGTLSYMMDGSSMVLSILDKDNDDPAYMQPKINRMMFFLNEDNDILQSRLYPQGRVPEYEDYLAKTVNQIIADALNIENSFHEVCSDVRCECYVSSSGVHYRDYAQSDFGQKIWSIDDAIGEFYIGHESYCVNCGEVNSRTSRVYCCDCDNAKQYARCVFEYRCPLTDRMFFKNDFTFYNDEDGYYYSRSYSCRECGTVFVDKVSAYCPECRETHEDLLCNHCQEPIVDDATEVGGEFYCEDCIDNYFSYCEDCGSYDYTDDMYYINNGDYYVCEHCFNDDSNYFYDEYYEEYRDDGDDSYYIEDYGRISDIAYENSGSFFCCECCGSYYHERVSNYVPSEDGYVCDDCISNNYYRCEECGEYIHYSDSIEDGGDNYCPTCFNYHSITCDRCGERHINCLEVDDEWICDDCCEVVGCCENCGDPHLLDNMTQDDDGNYYCSDCRNPVEEEDSGEVEDDTSSETTYPLFGTLNTEVDRFARGLSIKVLNSGGGISLIEITIGDSTYYRNVPSEYVTINN